MSEFNDLKNEAALAAREVLEHLYRLLLAAPSFRLSSGTDAAVEGLSEPHVDGQGRLTCGVDVSLGNGGHLEFTLRSTGWGMAIRMPRPYGPPSPSPSPGGRGC